MYKSWKRILKRESEFLKFEEREREEGGIFGQRIVLESFLSLSLFLSLLINETNEKKNVQELEKNSKEREGGIFGQRIVLGEPDGAKLSIYLVACTIGSLAHEFYYSSLCAANRKAV